MTVVPMNLDGIGHDRPASRQVDDETASLAAALAQAGHDGPILVVADNHAITRSGPAWARVFAARGWLHRVRVSAGGNGDGDGDALAAEAEALAREARTLQATVIVGVGSRATRVAARAAAAIAGLPAVMHPAMPAD